jgi:hypothetical protein
LKNKFSRRKGDDDGSNSQNSSIDLVNKDKFYELLEKNKEIDQSFYNKQEFERKLQLPIIR